MKWILWLCTRSPPSRSGLPWAVWVGGFEMRLYRIENKLDQLLALVQASATREESQMSAMGDAIAKLQADVAAETTVDQSAITLLNGIPQLIKDAAGDPSALNDLAASIEANTAGLASAVTQNTPAAPTA